MIVRCDVHRNVSKRYRERERHVWHPDIWFFVLTEGRKPVLKMNLIKANSNTVAVAASPMLLLL